MEIRVRFSSDMDKEPQSTDQSIASEREIRGGKEPAQQGESIGEIGIGTWKLFSCVLS